MEKEGIYSVIIILLVIFLVTFLFYNPEGLPRGGGIICSSDLECQPQNYCLGFCNSSGGCTNFSTCEFRFSCENSGTPESQCILVSQNCDSCLGHSCSEGICDFPVDINATFLNMVVIERDLVNITARVDNIGNYPIYENFYVNITIDNDEEVFQTSFVEFLPGATIYLSKQMRLPYGTAHYARFTADTYNDIIETNEENNFFWREYLMPP